MLKPAETITRALSQLENNPAWKEIVEWMENSLRVQSINNNYASGENTIKMQGRNMELDEILKHINKSHIYKINLDK